MVRDPETGRSWYIDTAMPTPDTVTIGQLGHGLESIRRFGGYTTRPITAAVREAEQRAYEAILAHVVRQIRGSEADQAVADIVSCYFVDAPPRQRADAGEAIAAALADAAPIVHEADELALYYEARIWLPGPEGAAHRAAEDPMPDLLLPLVWPADGEYWPSEVRKACNDVRAACAL